MKYLKVCYQLYTLAKCVNLYFAYLYVQEEKFDYIIQFIKKKHITISSQDQLYFLVLFPVKIRTYFF